MPAYDVAMDGAGDSMVVPVSRARPLTPAAVDQLVTAVRCALADEFGEPPASSPTLSDVEPDEFLRAVVTHRVAGLLSLHSEAVSLSPELAGSVRQLAMRDSVGAMRLAHETLRAWQAVSSAGIHVAVLKGAALSTLSTGSVGARGPGDIDLLVAPSDVARAHEALAGEGWSALDGWIPGAGVRWAWTSWLRREHDYGGGPVDVDLHWRVSIEPRLSPCAEDLLDRAVEVPMAGGSVRTLAAGDALGAACYHTYLDRHGRLRGLVDVVRLTRVPGARLGADHTRACRRMVGDVVGFAHGLIGNVPANRLADLTRGRTPDVAAQQRLWNEWSLLPLWSADAVPTRELSQMYRHQLRYAPALRGVMRHAAELVLPPERLSEDSGIAEVATGVIAEGRHLIGRRILRRE